MLEDDTGAMLTEHQDKADLIWTSFKDRLGVSAFSGLVLDPDLIANNQADFFQS